MSNSKKTPNRLMQSMIGISLIIHIMLFMHIAGIYQSNTLTYIELAMRDISKPFSRAIPRPRIRHHAPKVRNVKKLSIQKQRIPHIKINPVKNSFANTLMENISAPDIPDNAGPSISDWNPGWNPGGSEEFITSNDYFDMVRLKIENCKKYPESAKIKHIEGRIILQFVIAANGDISSLKIIKHAKHNSLGTAALNAVKKAAPFPIPPPNLFKEPLHVEITILFELT